ncbi:MAG: carbonic anhydrase [Metallosphaera sp.]
MRIVISCMDRRLNEFLEKNYNDGETVFIRNAGANINSLKETKALIKKADEIIILPHTDCGAMGVVERALNGEKLPNGLDTLISPFLGKGKLTRAQLEQLNPVVQETTLKSLTNAKITSKLIRTEELNAPPSKDNVAVMTLPSTRRYSEFVPKEMMYKTFIIQSQGNDGEIDALIAKEFLNVSEIKRITL